MSSTNADVDQQIETYREAVKANATVDDAIQYAKDVLARRIVAGKQLRQAARRFLDDFDNGASRGIKFSRNKANHALRFFPTMCVHIKGALADKPIVLDPWQAFIVVQLFGFYRKNRKGKWVRRYRYAYIEVARKNGKSTLLSGIALYMLAFDGEGGPEVWCAAVDKDQAKIVWDAAAAMVEKSPLLSMLLKVTRSINLVEYPDKNGVFGPLSRDSKKLDGKNVHCGVLDELHAHPDRKIFDLVKDGMSSRDQPILAVITTAGVNLDGICYEQRKYVCDILNPDSDVEDDNYLGVIFSIDEEDDPHDPEVWPKSNPGLGISKDLDAMEAQARLSKISAVALINYLIKDLNKWVNGGIGWMDVEKWRACARAIPGNLRDLSCWLGVDLSISGDVTALVLLFKTAAGWYVLPEFWYPKESLKDLPDETRALYEQWAREGFLNIMPGYMIDLDRIEQRVTELQKEYRINEVCVDPWKAHQLNFRLNSVGIDALDVGQTVRNFSEVMYTIDGHVNEQSIHHDGNPMMEHMMGNIEISIDKNDNIFPYKMGNDKANKIDGGTALFTAAFRAFIGGGIKKQSIYNTEEVGC